MDSMKTTASMDIMRKMGRVGYKQPVKKKPTKVGKDAPKKV